MKRFVALLVMFVMIGLLFLIGCSGSGTIPAGPSPGDSPLDPGVRASLLIVQRSRRTSRQRAVMM